MRPESIQKKEDDFFKDLTNSAGVKYKLIATTDIGNGVKIYSIRPEFDSYYYKTKTVKKSICLHFTVGYIKSDVAALSTKDNCVSVSYVVDRSGRIYEMFPDTEWSYHLGSGAVGGNIHLDLRPHHDRHIHIVMTRREPAYNRDIVLLQILGEQFLGRFPE